MSYDPKSLLYATTHEWVHVETDSAGQKVAVVGLSDFALHALTDLVHLDLPPVGTAVSAGRPFGEVESVKAVSDLYSPLDGEIVEKNTSLADNLDALTTDPYGNGWLVKIRIANEAGLLQLKDFAAYQKQCEEESAG